MNTYNLYTFTIIARKTGAIGTFGHYVVARRALNEDAALISLYDEYEHIRVLTVEVA